MAEAIISLDTREVEAGLRAIGPAAKAALAKALNRTAFEVIEAEKSEAGRVFSKSSPRGRQFFAGRGSYVFPRPATADRLEVTVVPRPSTRSAQIIAQHIEGREIAVESTGVRRLAVGGLLAVPVTVPRGPTGRVPAREKPAALLRRVGRRRRARGFVAGRALLERVDRARLLVRYALVERARLAAEFGWMRAARDAATRAWPDKVRQEIERARIGRRG